MLFRELKPYILNVYTCFCFATFSIVSKVSLNNGMSRYVLVVYAHAFGTFTTALLAFFFERNNESKISVPVLRNIFFLGLLGAVLGRTLFYAGLVYTSAALAAAMSNLIPSLTFVLAILCRMERLEISKASTQAKIGGTLVAFAGAALMTLYKGIAVISSFHRHSHQFAATSKSSLDGNLIKGSLMLIISYLAFAALYILQTATIKMYPAPISLTSLTCLVGTLLAAIMTVILDHHTSSWRLSWNITLLAPIYSGVMTFGITSYVQTVLIQMKGPVFMTAFRPLGTLIVATMELLIFGDALHLGSIVGATLIILGLYAILWGKEKEKEKEKKQILEGAICDQGIEVKPN